MKKFHILIPISLILLNSCKPKVDTTIPTETTPADSVVTDTSSVKSPDYFKVSFESPEAEKHFLSLFKKNDSNMLKIDTVQIDNTTVHKISFAAEKSTLIPIGDEPDFVENDLIPEGPTWDSEGTIQLLTTIPLSPIQLSSFFSTADSTYQIDRSNERTYQITSTDSGFNAMEYAATLNDLTLSHPNLVTSVFGSIEGIPELVNGTSPTLSGIAPVSLTTLAIRTAEPFEPNITNISTLLPGTSSGYSLKSSSSKQTLSAGKEQLESPHAKEISFIKNSGNDPIIELSTGSYDGAILFRNSDIRVVQSRMTNMVLTPIDTVTVYAVISMESPGIESELASAINPGAVKKGLPFESTIAQSLLPDEIPHTAMQPALPPMISGVITVLANEENSMELAIARKLVENLKSSGISAELNQSGESFGKRIYNNSYQILITSMGERLRNAPNAREYLKLLHNNKTKTPLLHVPLFLAADKKVQITENDISTLVKLK